MWGYFFIFEVHKIKCLHDYGNSKLSNKGWEKRN